MDLCDSPCTGASPTPDLVTVVDERRQIGSSPAGGGVGSAGAPRGPLPRPPPCQQDEGLDRGEQKTALAYERVGNAAQTASAGAIRRIRSQLMERRLGLAGEQPFTPEAMDPQMRRGAAPWSPMRSSALRRVGNRFG